MTNQQIYQERADECAREATAATLLNVRERCLRSQAAWQLMADREARAILTREANEQAKATVAG